MEGDVLNGKVTEEHRVANDQADVLAERARRSNTEWESADFFCNAFAVRQRTFPKLVWQIGVQHVRVFLAIEVAKEEAERLAPFTTNAESKYIPTTLEYTDPTNSNARLFQFQMNGILHGHIREKTPAGNVDVLYFVCGLRFVPTCSIGNGISWIELYVLFLVHAKQTLEPTSGNAGPSLCKRLRVFTSQVRSVISCFLM